MIDRPSHARAGTDVARGALVAVALLLALAQAGTAPAAAQEPGSSPVRSCESLAELRFDDGTQVTSASTVPAQGDAPAHCSVTLRIPERINVAIGLPEEWNGRYQAAGNGGYAGAILSPPASDPALAAGYAVSATDTGHQGGILTGEWAWSPPDDVNRQLIEDFAYRANHEMAVKTKQVVEAYYGAPPAYSYWNGCSTGGREGLTEAMRYPDDFDGIAAAAPAINWTRFIPAEFWPQMAQMDAGHRVDPCKLTAATQAAVEACDPADGLDDGLIDPRACDVEAADLVGTATSCGVITEEDAAIIQQIWDGPRRPDGRFLWYGLYPGTDLGSLPAATLGHSVTAPGLGPVDGAPFPITTDWLKWFVHKDAAWDWRQETYEQYIADFDQSVREYAGVLGTDQADLSAFRDSGGKVLIWHGMVDQLIFGQGTVDYYERVVRRMGGLDAADDFARLFMVPNVAHCSGGDGPQPVGVLEAVVRWVEEGVAPDTLMTSLPAGSGVNDSDAEMTRPVCPWPLVAQHDGAGSPYDAASFTCEAASWSASIDSPTATPAASVSRRLAGPDRYATAIAVAQDRFPEDGSAPAVVLARGDGFADALAGTPLAVARGAALLLTPGDRLLPAVTAEVQRVLADGGTVHLLGGPAALSPAVEERLVELGFGVQRIAGATRFETAVAIAEELDAPTTVLLTTGADFPDALAAGAAAAHAGGAVLLTDGDRPAAATEAYLAAHPDVRRVAVGGPATRAHPDADPVAGVTREETAVAVSEAFFSAPQLVGLASSGGYADALVGGARVAAEGGPVLLTPTDRLSAATADHLCDLSVRFDGVLTFGGTSAVAEAVRAAADAGAEGGGC